MKTPRKRRRRSGPGSVANSWIVIAKAWDSFFIPFIPDYPEEQAIFGSSVAALKCARKLQKTGRYEEIYVTCATDADFQRPKFPPLPT